MLPILSTAAVIALVVIAGGWDLRTRRIPNWLTVSALGCALVIRALVGWDAVLSGLQGAGIALLICLPLFVLGAFGGGDAKLLLAVGAFLGPLPFGTALLAAGATGFVLALGVGIRQRVVLVMMLRAFALVKYGATFGRSGDRMTITQEGAISVPYGIAIGAGALVGWFYHGGIL